MYPKIYIFFQKIQSCFYSYCHVMTRNPANFRFPTLKTKAQKCEAAKRWLSLEPARTKCTFFFLHIFACPARPSAGRFACSRLWGTQGAVCTPKRKCGSRPGSVARALGIQIRAIWPVITASLSASPSLASSFSLCGSNERCFCVCPCVPSNLPGYQVYDRMPLIGTQHTNISRTAVQLELSALDLHLFRSAVCCCRICITPSSRLCTL